MKKCPNCNGKYEDHIKKCSACGVPLVDCNDAARRCKRCGRELAEDEIVCRSCEEAREAARSALKEDDLNSCGYCGAKLKTPWEKEHRMCADCHNRLDPEEPQDVIGNNSIGSNKEKNDVKIKPRSLNGLESLSFWFRLVDVVITIIGIFAGFVYYNSTENLFLSIIVAVAIASLGFFYMMMSTLFQALHDIVRGIYHIANK